jgi:hypothetical protein
VQETNAAGTVSIASVDSAPGSIRMVVDLAAALGDALPRILPVVGRGPVQNAADLLNQNVAAALVPSDVLPYLVRTRRLPEAERSLRYIAGFYQQDVHVLALVNFTSLARLAGAPVNFGPPDSHASITASTIFDSLGIHVQPVFQEPEAALQALQQRRIAALVHVARAPAPLFFDLNQGDGVHFLPVPQTPELSRIYLPSRLGIADYPLLIGQGEAGRGQPIPTAAVPVVIAVANPAPGTARYRNLALLTNTLFPLAMTAPKGAPDSIWADFNPALEVPGWQRFPPAAARLQGKTAATVPENAVPPATRRAAPRADQPHERQSETNLRQQREKLFEEYLRWRQTQGSQ